MNMLWKFSAYGFLKNLRFFEPFMILYFLEIGLSYLDIGLLVSFRAVLINVLEIPSGALSDLYGRKNAMILSLLSYIASFILFAMSSSLLPLFPAMAFFAVGEAFRTGTHKAMIFSWLSKNGKIGAKTKVYGFTRSWSQTGSALSAVIAAAIVIFFREYQWVFIFSIVPYLFGIWNIATYPSYLNTRVLEKTSIRDLFAYLFRVLKSSIRKKELRRLIVQSTGFNSVFDVTGNFLQPVLKAQAGLLLAGFFASEQTNVAAASGAVYFVIYLLSAVAARKAHLVADRAGSPGKATALLVLSAAVLLIVLSAATFYESAAVAIGGFIVYYMLHNIWSPLIVTQYDDCTEDGEQATVLSIESQTKSAGVLVLAPLAGIIADEAGIPAMFLAFSILMIILTAYSLREQRTKKG